jgi:hypothetical protein
MNRIYWVAMGAVLAVFVCFQTRNLAEAASSKATVTSVRGTVLVRRAENGPPVPVRSGMALQAGDQLEVLPKSRATLLLPWGALKILRTGETYVVPGEAPAGEGPGLLPLSQNVVSVFLASREKTGEMEKLDIRAGTRSAEGGLDQVFLLSPRNTAIVSHRPTFIWSSLTDATSYTITVLGDKGKVLEAETSSANFIYESGAPALEPGILYFWEVVATTPQAKVSSGKAHFTILSREERNAVRALDGKIKRTTFSDPEDSSSHYLLAHIYIDKGLYEMAARSLLRAVRMNSNDQGLIDLLQGVYREMQLDHQGIALFQELI